MCYLRVSNLCEIRNEYETDVGCGKRANFVSILLNEILFYITNKKIFKGYLKHLQYGPNKRSLQINTRGIR